jgi:hypothetical protein
VANSQSTSFEVKFQTSNAAESEYLSALILLMNRSNNHCLKRQTLIELTKQKKMQVRKKLLVLYQFGFPLE